MEGTRGHALVAGATVVAALIGAMAMFITARAEPTLVIPSDSLPTVTVAAQPTPNANINPPSAEAVTVTVTETSTVTETATVTMAWDGKTVITDRPKPSVYLQDLEPIEGYLSSESVTFGGETYASSLLNPMSGCSSQGPVRWEIPRDAALFQAVAGVPVDAAEGESRVTFIVRLDGSEVYNETHAVGKSQEVNIDVRGAQVLMLESIIDESRRSNCNTEADAVWGNASFHWI